MERNILMKWWGEIAENGQLKDSPRLVNGSALGLHRQQDVGIELRCAPAAGGANLCSGEAEGATEIGAAELGAVDWGIAQDCAGEGCAAHVCVS